MVINFNVDYIKCYICWFILQNLETLRALIQDYLNCLNPNETVDTRAIANDILAFEIKLALVSTYRAILCMFMFTEWITWKHRTALYKSSLQRLIHTKCISPAR